MGLVPVLGHADVITMPTATESTITAVLYQDGGGGSYSDQSYIATNSDESGVYVKNSGKLTLSNVTITTSGDSSTYADFPLDASGQWGTNSGVLANGGTLTITGGSINTSGEIANGAFATAGGVINISGTKDIPFTIVTTGYNSHGVDATDGSTINLSYVDISTSGLHASGVGTDATGGSATSTVTVDNCNVSTSGLYSSGVYVDAAGIINVNNSKLTATGDVGAVVAASGVLNLTDTQTTGLIALKVYCPNEATNGTATVSGGSLTSTDGDAIEFSSDTGTVTVENGTQVIASNGILVDAVSSSAATFKAINESLTGNIVADSTSTLAVTLENSTLTGAVNPVDLTMDANSLWNVTGNSELTNFSLSNGTVKFSNSSGGTYYTIADTGTLSGSGTFHMNANLATGLSDLITIGGIASGKYNLYFSGQNSAVSLGGAIKVVDLNDSVSNTAIFSGGGDLGAYRYAVAQGSSLAGSYSGIDSSDYYLYNTYSPSTPAYAAIDASSATVVDWYDEMNSIQKHVDQLRSNSRSSDDFWVQTYGDHFKITPRGSQAFNENVGGIELGKDNASSFTGGKKVLGFLVGTAKGNNSFSTGGTGTTDSVFLSGYESWVMSDGCYFDLIGKYSRFSNSFTAPLLGGGNDSGNFKNNGTGLAAELGKRVEEGNGFFIEPQVGVMALWSNKATYTSANGLMIDSPSYSNLNLSISGTVGKKTTTSDGTSQEIYTKVSWIQGYGSSQTYVDQASFDSSLKGNQLVAEVGFTRDAANNQIYLDVDKSWGRSIGSYGGKLGYAWKF